MPKGVAHSASDAKLLEAVAHARQLHPDFQVSEATFLAYAKARLAVSPETGELVTTHLPDLLIAFCAQAEDGGAVRSVISTLEREVVDGLRRQRGLQVRAEDVSQHLLVRLLVGGDGREPKLGEYKGGGPLGAWLRVVALGTALNLDRHERGKERASSTELEDLQLVEEDPELRYARASCRVEFDAAFRHAMTLLSSKERTLLRLRFLDRLTLSELAEYFKVHRGTVVRWLSEVSASLDDQIRSELCGRLALGQREIDSLLRAVKSQPDFSLGELLRSVSR